MRRVELTSTAIVRQLNAKLQVAPLRQSNDLKYLKNSSRRGDKVELREGLGEEVWQTRRRWDTNKRISAL